MPSLTAVSTSQILDDLAVVVESEGVDPGVVV
jgi:hypothetical protein